MRLSDRLLTVPGSVTEADPLATLGPPGSTLASPERGDMQVPRLVCERGSRDIDVMKTSLDHLPDAKTRELAWISEVVIADG